MRHFNALIIGSGKIGIDLYFKCKKIKIFNNIIIFNRNSNSTGSNFLRKKKITFFSSGVNGIKKFIKNDTINIIFDATSSLSSLNNYQKVKKWGKNYYYINLTPSNIGSIIIPYFEIKKIPNVLNMITCGGQSSVPIIKELKKKIKSIKYVELVSSISSQSAGPATRQNIDEYINTTQKAISQIGKVKHNKVIINLNPNIPPVNMMNSLFFETKDNLNKNSLNEIQNIIRKVNRLIKVYIPGYNIKLFNLKEKNFFRITIRVVGQGDYLPKFSGNLDIITSASVYIAKKIYEKNFNK